MDSPDRFAQNLGDADGFYLLSDGKWRAVCGDELFNVRFRDTLTPLLVEYGMGNAGKNPLGTIFLEKFCRRGEGAGRFGDVIDEENVLPFHFAD